MATLQRGLGQIGATGKMVRASRSIVNPKEAYVAPVTPVKRVSDAMEVLWTFVA
jgi:hypothetical protein